MVRSSRKGDDGSLADTVRGDAWQALDIASAGIIAMNRNMLPIS
jgi:hypothetical protein